MIFDTPALRLISPARRRRGREALLVAASAVVDGVAMGAMLTDTAGPHVSVVLAATALHAAATLLLAGVTDASASRRHLGLAAQLVVPFAGAAVAAAANFTRGRGSVATRRRRSRRPLRPPTASVILRLGHAPPLGDELGCVDGERRRAALIGLSRRSDAEAIALLRWAASGRDPDLALASALALDEIGERAERESVQADLERLRYGAR